MSNQTTTKLVAGGALLFTSSVISRLLWRRYRGAQPDKLLKKVKHQLSQQAPISGSWIDFQPQRYQQHWAYRGGIRQADHEYRFVIATNGQLLAGHWLTL
ncbi:hypothetical protein [Loigolactobacillus jiayinensis]|uniref:PepSY domain-containing protein n=1 Tax=Loigolactobacillus jiayinensis TaxID=2486016 RepID=A0ABW1RFX9_9LACO|nr:hypothetical protein [Loigolactobacillus jiayinensis]